MSKRPVPSSPQHNSRPLRMYLTSCSQNEAQPEKPHVNTQADLRKALHDETNAPKVTIGKPKKVAQKTATDTTAAKPKVAIAPKTATSSTPVAQPKSKTGDVATKPSTASHKGKLIKETILSSDGSDDRDSDYEDVPDDEQDNDDGLVAEHEVDEPHEAELIPEDKSDAEPEEDKPEDAPATKPKRGREPKPKDGEGEPVAKAKANSGGSKSKGKVQRAKPSTNRVERESKALTIAAVRDIFNGVDKFLNKWAKCSELAILRSREKLKAREIDMAFLDKEIAQHQALVNYENTWLEREPDRVEEYHKIQLQDSERKLLEAQQKTKKMSMERLSLEMELLKLRDDYENLKKKQKEKEEAEEEEERRDTERVRQLYNDK